MGGNEVSSLGMALRQPKRRRTDTSDVARDLAEKGDQAFYWNSLLRYTRNQVMIRPILVSPISPVPHYGNRPKIGIVGNLRSWRIQRRRLQGFWIRTHEGRQDLPGNNQGGSDKEYWRFPFLEAPF